MVRCLNRAAAPVKAAQQSGEPSTHTPVLFQPVLDGLQIKPGGRYIDATLGGGGHAQGILAASAPDGRLLGLDRDPAAVEGVRARLAATAERCLLVHSSYAHVAQVAHEHRFDPVDGILFDLGLSSLQLADSQRGFAFMREGPLDMRFDPTVEGPTAATLVNELSLNELTTILYDFGEERQARRIARAIIEARPVRTTSELAAVIEQVSSGTRRPGGPRGRIHPATRAFQALRIAVNGELAALELALPEAVQLLAPGGRLVVISFHSLEDRLVKRFMRRESQDCICPPGLPICTCEHRATLHLVGRKAVKAKEEEIEANPRARSARLRVAERLG